MDFDAIVIGAGQAGPSLAVRLAQSGRKTAIVDLGCVAPRLGPVLRRDA
jgi:pyruvate/2-oxoglutarate dehydrogenase complex dihydrolipoamide dehydrogenase (E3) component